MAFCTQCGKELQDGLRFCPECGTAVVAEPRSADEPPIATAVKDVADAVESVIPEFPSAGGVVEVLVPAEVGEATLSTWKSVPPAAQAIGAAVGEAQRVSQTAKDSPAQAAQPTSGNQTEQFKSHGPTAHYSSSGGEAKPASEKKKSKLPLIMIAAGAVVLVAVFALYVVPLFIPHPYDPNSHVALTSDSSSSASGSSTSSTSSSEGSSGSSSSSSNGSASSSASASSSSSSASSSSSTSGGSPTATGSYSTDERPTISEFKWMTGETDKGNAPAGAARIVDFGTVMGGWKAYMYGDNLERLLNVSIDAGQAGAVVTLDWYYIRDNKQDKVFEDTTPSSSFTGSFDGGMLDATGSGRITLTAFWEQDGHQYASGSFMWPSGETEAIALVRP